MFMQHAYMHIVQIKMFLQLAYNPNKNVRINACNNYKQHVHIRIHIHTRMLMHAPAKKHTCMHTRTHSNIATYT